MSKFGIMAIPTMIFFKNGKEPPPSWCAWPATARAPASIS
jgi:hypothetical protein